MFTYSPRQPTTATSVSNIMLVAAVFTLGCVAMALPVSESASSKHDLNNLMSLLGKLKDAHRIRHNVLDSAAAAMANQRHGKTSSAIDAMLLQRAAADADFDTDVEDDENTSSEMRKRQGAWSYDYGLGGGRFGKRGGYGYPDYGLGGGRFGRDVDHVDPNHDIDVDNAGL